MTIHQIINTVLFYKGKIISITLILAGILFLLLLLVFPKTYIATVSILPPEKNQNIQGLGALLSGGELTSLIGAGSSNTNSQLYIEILKSRSVAEYVVRKLNLVDYFGAEDITDACAELTDRLVLNVNKEGIVRLGVEIKTSYFPLLRGDKDETKMLAANLSNTFIEALDKINREKLSSKARNAREYIEEQLKVTKTKLDSAELALMNFQQKNKTISLPDQLKAVIEGAAELKTEIVQTEVEIGLLSTNLREDNRTLVGLKEKLSNLQKQYDRMEIGNQDYILAFKDVPELGREMAVLLRDLKIQNEVYIILQQQYYKERIQENRDLPTVEILDEAIPPKKAVSPKIIYSSFFGGIFIFLLISMIFVFSEKNNFSRK